MLAWLKKKLLAKELAVMAGQVAQEVKPGQAVIIGLPDAPGELLEQYRNVLNERYSGLLKDKAIILTNTHDTLVVTNKEGNP